MGKKTKIESAEKVPERKICEVQSQAEYMSLETIQKVIAEKVKEKVIKDYAYILHDKDEDEDGKVKKPHYHVYLRFHRGQTFERIASWFGLDISYVRIIKTNFDYACAYLIHRNSPDKFQYDPAEVVSSFDYLAFLAQLSEKEKKKLSDENYVKNLKKQIFDEVQAGTLRGYNFHEKYNLEERTAFRPYLDKLVDEIIKTKIYSNEQRKLEVIYIHGDSGMGKTAYAKEIAKRRGFHYAVSGEDRDPLEAYAGQPCMILDEMRASSMKLANFLKLIDNNTESQAGARYRGKTLIECRLIIITSIDSVTEFFNKLQENDRETAVQIKRRCKTLLRMKFDKISIYKWDDYSREYKFLGDTENPIPKMYEIKKKTVFDLQVEAAEILGLGLLDITGVVL